MTTIETIAVVSEDRRLLLQLPDVVLPGEHRIRVEIDPIHVEASAENLETPVAWDGDVLVYAGGEFSGDIRQFIDDDREDRISQIFGSIVQ